MENICDFGAMRYEGEISNEYTHYYAAPEYFYNNNKRNNKSDMWAVGIIMIEMFYIKNYIKNNKIFDAKEKKKMFSEIGIKKKYDSSKEEENKINYEKIKEIVQDENAFHLIEKLVAFNPDNILS